MCSPCVHHVFTMWLTRRLRSHIDSDIFTWCAANEMSLNVMGTHLPCSIMQPCIMQVPPNTRVKCALGFAPMRDEAMQLIQLSKENASTWSLFYMICMEDLRHEVEIAWNGIRRVDSLCSVEKGSDSRQRIEAEFHFPGICKPRVHRWQKNVASLFLHIIFRYFQISAHATSWAASRTSMKESWGRN